MLLVESNESVRRMLLNAISSWGMITRDASSGDEALDIAGKESFDFAIVDISLPDRSGSSLAKDLKALNNNTLVLSLSPLGYNKSAGDASISGWITKPVKSHHLRSMLIDLLQIPLEDLALMRICRIAAIPLISNYQFFWPRIIR